MSRVRIRQPDRAAQPMSLSRRRFLLASAGVASASTAGCLGGGDDADAPEPITVPEGATCEVCGMVIRQHPGPTTEIFYRDQQPSGHENPARFDSVWEAYQYEFEKDDAGWEDVAFYVTDYSSVDYETFEDGGDTLITRHYEASSFAPASEVTYVVNSEVKGTMGRDLLGFTERSDAEAFQSEWGGSLTTHDGVTPEIIAGLGT
ncbi:nitrous oxide reductase accessory protein NosL [Halobellus marinus]|jgi:copper chaperone NosL|uniref:nitrous oxide reductase accessory protein NosL n=1 Tax=Halobellus TaxID=1073986 RepID=UPI0028AA216B|nr:nitrous oxide reductase accessory protein NosL [Halobellus sp. DFY28]